MITEQSRSTISLSFADLAMDSTSASASSLPSTQTVWKIVRKGDPAKVLVKEENAPVPKKIPKGHVLVKIQAASLNPVYVHPSSCSNPSMPFLQSYNTFVTGDSN